MFERRRAFRLTLAASALSALVFGCRCADKATRASAADAGRRPAACQRDARQLTLVASGTAAVGPTDAMELGTELPFSVEPGVAVGSPSGFFVTALRHETRGATALLAHWGGSDRPGEVIELGRLHGDVVAPRLALAQGELVVALAEATASGQDVRVGRVHATAFAAPGNWQGPLQRKSYESSGFELAALGDVAVVVWDEWSSGARRSAIRATSISKAAEPGPAAAPFPSRLLSEPGADAEAPRISPRPGGFWVSWLARASQGESEKPRFDRRLAAADAGQLTAVVQDEERVIELVPLDAAGAPNGAVRRVGRPGPIVGHDLATSEDGQARIVWRQGAFSAGALGGEVILVKIALDGTEQILPLRADDVGAGIPSFLAAELARSPWLSFPDRRDVSLLVPLADERQTFEVTSLDGPLLGASAMAASGRQLLFAAPRGRSIELFVASCGR